MGSYVTDKDKMNFKTLDSLESVKRVIAEADRALNDSSRTIDDSTIPEALAGGLGAAAGAGISFAALYAGGSVVGLSAAGITSGLAAAGAVIGSATMTAGLAVLAAPVAILGVGAALAASKANNDKLMQAKEACYKNAIKKQNEIFKLLEKQSKKDKARIDYLVGLNNLLVAAIEDLSADLGVA